MGIDPLVLVARVIAFLTAIPFHEAAHAFVSDKLGDPTARAAGRLTLNPIKHFDVFGLIAMLLIGVGWAKPVPINVNYYKNKKKGMAISAVAGPISNLILGFVMMIVWKLFIYIFALASSGTAMAALPAWFEWVYTILQYQVLINVTLAVFNMIPIPPLDGSRLLLLFLPEKIYFGLMKYERILMIVILALVWLGVLGRFLSFVSGYVFQAFDWATGWLDSLYYLLAA